MLDVRFDEGWYRVLDRTIQENLNIIRKFALNTNKVFKSNTSFSKAVSKTMLDCMLNLSNIIKVINTTFVSLGVTGDKNSLTYSNFQNSSLYISFRINSSIFQLNYSVTVMSNLIRMCNMKDGYPSHPF